MNKKGFGFSLVILVVAALALVAVFAVGGYYYSKTTPAPSVPPPSSVASSTVSSSVSVSPGSGPVGTVITLHGTGFAATGNTVTLNGMVDGSTKNLTSADGKTIMFSMPSSLGPNCKPNEACPMYLLLVTNNTYTIAVISNGNTQTIGTFTVTGKPLQAL
jgi:hypothetical protein